MDRFFGIKVQSGQSLEFKTPLPLHLTQVALDAHANAKERTALEITIGDQTHTVGSCRSGQVDQFPLDLLFNAETDISFKTVGPNTLHVLGSYIIVEDYDEFDEAEESDGEEDIDLDALEDDEEGEDLSDEEEAQTSSKVTFDPKVPASKPSTISAKRVDTPKKKNAKDQSNEKQAAPAANTASKANGKQTTQSEATNGASKKRKNDEMEESPKKVPKDTIALKEDAQKAQPSKKAKTDAATPEKKQAEKKTSEKTPEKKTPEKKTPETTPEKELNVKRQMLGGLVVEDLKVGNGALIKDGKKIGVKYIGSLTSGKTFDSSLKSPFVFRYGTGEVIKGWDLGLKGMKVGGKRKLTIPAKLGYGAERAGAIPPNSTLIFEVELTKVF